MLIGIDASRTFAERPTGTETYSQRLIQELLKLRNSHRFRLYFRNALPPDAFSSAEKRRAEIRIIPFPRLWTHLRLSWEMIHRPPDALFVPAHVLPLIHPRVSLVTIHDLGYLYFPEAHPWRQRFYLDLSTRWSACTATHLLVDSRATRADLINHYNVPPEKITVAYPGVDETLAPVHDQAAIEAVKARYGIQGDYFLYLGTLQPRKNLKRLVEALSKPETQNPKRKTYLVLAGKRGWFYKDLFEQVHRLGMDDRVIFPGYVADDDKASLLSGALAFTFPSLHEGFGLPVLEAQACGCPVITSTTSGLPEVAGDGALLVDPEDTAAIAASMQRVAMEPNVRRALIDRGFANVRRFSWRECARAALNAIEKCASVVR